MRYADIKLNDVVDGDGVCVSLWVQGCPHRCVGCHNSETWDFDKGYEYTEETSNYILKSISLNNIDRNFSILGGEPLCEQNINGVLDIIKKVRKMYPGIAIYLWTGYTLEELQHRQGTVIDSILLNIDYLIEGRFIRSKRNITLRLRGSSNQRIFAWDSTHTYFIQVE